MKSMTSWHVGESVNWYETNIKLLYETVGVFLEQRVRFWHGCFPSWPEFQRKLKCELIWGKYPWKINLNLRHVLVCPERAEGLRNTGKPLGTWSTGTGTGTKRQFPASKAICLYFWELTFDTCTSHKFTEPVLLTSCHENILSFQWKDVSKLIVNNELQPSWFRHPLSFFGRFFASTSS